MGEQKDLVGKTAVITGANTGIGRVTAEKLAARGAVVILACRSEERTQPVVDGIVAAGGEAHFVALDLGDLSSVRAAAAQVIALGKPIDLLINNAGLAGKRGLTKDGFEIAFGTNHLGHFLWTLLLAPHLRPALGTRIVNVASKSHYSAKGIDFDAVKRVTTSRAGLSEYAVSKLANVLFTVELARRLGEKGIHSYSLHPGVVASDVWREVPALLRPVIKLFMLSNEDGAKTTLYCATSPDCAQENGKYYDTSRTVTPGKLAQDSELAAALWHKSLELTGAPDLA